MKRLIVKSSLINGNGLFADEDIKKGEFIQYITGRRVKRIAINKNDGYEEMKNWYGVGRSIWIDPEGTQFAYLNHSCEPNSAIGGTKSLIAMEDIKAGDEISIDYSITDPDPFWEMECACKKISCRKIIRSIEHVPTSVFKKHFPNVPRYFQKRYIRHYIKSKIE